MNMCMNVCIVTGDLVLARFDCCVCALYSVYGVLEVCIVRRMCVCVYIVYSVLYV